MKPTYKLNLILASIFLLNVIMGFDLRFTIINLVWCIPIGYDLYKEYKMKMESDSVKKP